MIRRRHEDDDDNEERWLVSYADFITLLFAFFVVMYSVSSFKKVQHDELTQAINAAFSNKKQLAEAAESETATTENTAKTAPLPADIALETPEAERESMGELGTALANAIAPLIKQQQARIMQNKSGLHIVILDQALFADGSADLSEAGNATMRSIGELLKASNHAILVEGHTDNTPIHIQNAALFSNWELSAVRASSIIGTFSQLGLTKSRLSALGYGPSQPIANNETATGRLLNRHTAILVLYDSISMGHDLGVEIQPTPDSPNGSNP